MLSDKAYEMLLSLYNILEDMELVVEKPELLQAVKAIYSHRLETFEREIDADFITEIAATRVEVFDDDGEVFRRKGLDKVEVSIQDYGNTLKVFIYENSK